MLLLLGFGMPPCELEWLPSSALFWGCASLILVYGAYVAEVLRAGINPCTPPNEPPPARWGCRTARTMRTWSSRRRSAGSCRPLLNDLVR